jgi:hypothetical protein
MTCNPPNVRRVLEIKTQSCGYGAAGGKADRLSEERRRLDAADCTHLLREQTALITGIVAGGFLYQRAAERSNRHIGPCS